MICVSVLDIKIGYAIWVWLRADKIIFLNSDFMTVPMQVEKLYNTAVIILTFCNQAWNQNESIFQPPGTEMILFLKL